MIPPRSPWFLRAACTGVCLLGSLLGACDRVPGKVSGKVAEKTWTDIPAARPEDRVTIHYHRQDGNYDGVEVWTWNAHGTKAPQPNELTPLGQDSYGAVFQFDRASFGGSDKIGLITRVGHNWDHKDGGDKFWTPAAGNEVWLVGKKNEVFAQLPDLSPHIEAAFFDGPTAVAASLSEAPPTPMNVSILDEGGTTHGIRMVFPIAESGHPASIAALNASSYKLAIVPKEPLDVANGHYRLQVEGFGAAVPFTPRGILENRDLFFDADAHLGAACTPQATTFRLFAPSARAVSVVLYDQATGNAGRTARALQPQAKGLWEATVDGDLRGKFYVCLLDGPDLDPTREVIDPYAVNAVESGTRGRLTEASAPPRPGPRVESPTDLVVYEMHVRDFTISPDSGVQNRGCYLGFTEAGTHLPGDPSIRTALDHLTELGVTHVELLPVQDFAGDEANPAYNWGYAPTGYFSPDGTYATNPADDSRVRELKALIDALHARGIGVIMDVVYNHTGDGAPFSSILPGYYYRHLPDGSPANGSGCGNEFRTEAPMARKLILDSLAYWTKEYGVDGYRFDLMALVDRETMREADRTLRAINPNIVLYGEPWSAGGTPLRDKTDKTAFHQVLVGAFNDDFRNVVKGSPDGVDAGFIQNGLNGKALKNVLLVSGWLESPGQSINYLTCHDNLVLVDKLKRSMPGAGEDALVAAMKLGYLVLFTSQGVPFIQGGEEFARTKGGNNNSYNAPDAVNQVDWSLKRKHLDLFNYTRDAIALRKAHPVFRLRTREEVAARLKFGDTPSDKTVVYTLDADGVPGETWKRACVVLNGDSQAGTDIGLPEGPWSVAMDEHGASTGRVVTGKVTVGVKSGMVLYQ